MIARLTYFRVNSEDVEDLKKIYNQVIVPIIKRQKGNIGAWLLEPADVNDEYISLTEWSSKADAEAYESSGTYEEMLSKARDRFKSTPVLRTYTAAESKIIATA